MENGPKLHCLDVMSNSPLSHKQRQGNLEGESGSESEVT